MKLSGKHSPYSFFLGALLIFLCPLQVQAQVRADFNADKYGGCSPLTVTFTNTSTNTSSQTSWHWDFGNGNTSTLKDPSAIFLEEKAYTVTLTIKDGNTTSVQTKQFTVYKKPVVDFALTPANGCIPMDVQFRGSATGGDGTITGWHWDFGDGSTQQAYSPTVNHTYQFVQTASVSLTATSNYGCTNTITKENVVTVKPSVETSFTADRTVVCDPQGTINFTSNTTGPGPFTYQWDFGDGESSTVANPSHAYTKKGIYTVRLTVINSDGCSVSSMRNEYINIGSFIAEFTMPSLICEQSNIMFDNRSSPTNGQSRWYVNDVLMLENYYNSAFYHAFPQPGTYAVRLENNFGACQQSVTKQIEVKNKPVLEGFVVEPQGLCGAPLKVNFKDTSQSVTKWRWNFNYHYDNGTTHANTASGSYTYPSDNLYYVRLVTENASGCTAEVVKQVAVTRPRVGVYLQNGNTYERACGSLEARFESRSTEEITSYRWDFGDGKTSTEARPVHVFTTPGTYYARLYYTTINGCTGVSENYIPFDVYEKPKAAFTVQSEVCGNTPVSFTSQSTGYINSYIWSFGDGNTINSAHSPSVVYKYEREGIFDVRLIAVNGICNDTLVKPAFVNVKPPFPDIVSYQTNCENTRGLVRFTDNTRQAETYHWNFGDGQSLSYTTPPAEITHTYTRSGTYKAVLTTTNGGCTVKDSITVHVLLKQKPVLFFDTDKACANKAFGFSITGLDLNPIANLGYSYHHYSIVKWEYEDGTDFQGQVYYDVFLQTRTTGTFTPNLAGNGRVRAILRSAFFDCYDTTNFVNMKVLAPKASFEIVNNNVCFKSPVTLRNTSASGSVLSWVYGDGTFPKESQINVMHHIYANPGIYYPTLTVQQTQDISCNNTTDAYANPVIVHGIKAAFYSSAGNINTNTPVNFYNNSNTSFARGVAAYRWDFGDGQTSTEHSPSHTYTAAGTYTVSLIATDLGLDCHDTLKTTIVVQAPPPPDPVFTQQLSFIGDHGACPPVQASFSLNSNNPYSRLVWDFGDGFTLENQRYPSHIYTEAGEYTVTLTLYNNLGNSFVYTSKITVGFPPAPLDADKFSSCLNQDIRLFSAAAKNSYSYTWDFGNGHITPAATDSTTTHRYTVAGIYTPSLIVRNAAGCAVANKLNTPVTIHPDPTIQVNPALAIACKEQGAQLQASGAQTYSWSPALGLSATTIANPVANPDATTRYTVAGTDAHGCTGSTEISVTKPEPITIQSASAAGICIGDKAQLGVTGANSYNWIQSTNGLSQTNIANPVATPVENMIYTVVGYDQYQCQTDTLKIPLSVYPLPFVNAGADQQIVLGTPITLQANGSTDVQHWQWSPADFLSCTNCRTPVSTPYTSMDYVVTVRNQYQCVAKDTVHLKAVCSDNEIFIPNAFTPNHDGKNDVFGIVGRGVNKVVSFQVFNRWGELVFERKDFAPGDARSNWDGRYKGAEAPVGAYVYFAELECTGGSRYERKGSVILTR